MEIKAVLLQVRKMDFKADDGGQIKGMNVHYLCKEGDSYVPSKQFFKADTILYDAFSFLESKTPCLINMLHTPHSTSRGVNFKLTQIEFCNIIEKNSLEKLFDIKKGA